MAAPPGNRCLAFDTASRAWHSTPDPDDEEPDDDATGIDEELDDDETDQDAAQGDDSDPDEPQRHGTPQVSSGQAWAIILGGAERGLRLAGRWRPGTRVDFMEQPLADDYAERENKRRFGRGFDWANDPGRAWVAVRVGTRGWL